MLAICFVCQKFHQYIYGKSIDVHSDRSPPPRIDSEETGRQGLTTTATDDASVAAVYDELQVIHEGHLGRDKCKARARVSMYCPLMGVDIEEVVGRCAVCQKYRAANQKEPLIPHSVPALRWQQVALDIMTHKGKDYLVAVDCQSFPRSHCSRGKPQHV